MSAVALNRCYLIGTVARIEPSYEQKRIDAPAIRGKLRLVASPDGREESVTIRQDAYMFAGLFDASERTVREIARGRSAYAHIARGTVTINGQALVAGDALKVSDISQVTIEGGKGAEVVLFDLA